MLALSRHIGESVILEIPASSEATRVQVQLVDARGRVRGGRERAKLGFEAPSHVRIHREEVQKEIDSGNMRPARAGRDQADATRTGSDA